MTFLSPLYLWLLPLISVPIIIHLLTKRHSKLIDFPSLKFLKILEQDALRKFNIKQLILLILRTLMILLIILIFARPNLNTSGNFKLFSTRSDLAVIVLDNTASNQTGLAGLSRTWLAGFAHQLRGKGFKVVFTGLTDWALTDDPESIQPTYAGATQQDLLTSLIQQLDLSRYRERHLIWIGDGQDATGIFAQLADWKRYLLQQQADHDWGISSIVLPVTGLRQGGAYTLEIGVTHAAEDLAPQSLNLIINENRQNQTAVDVAMDFLSLSARVAESGFQMGQLILGQDEQSYNNSRYFVLSAGLKTPIQIVRQPGSPDFWQVLESGVTKTDLNYAIHLLRYDELDNLALTAGGTVIIEDAQQLQAYTWSRLQTFVSQGGQLILFGDGGDRMRKILSFNQTMERQISPFPFGLRLTAAGKTYLESAPIEAALDQERVKIYQRFQGVGNELDETWIRFLDDQPFLGAAVYGHGRVVWFNTDFGVGAGNLPVLGLFPPLLLKLSERSGQVAKLARYNANIGDTLNFYPGNQTGVSMTYSIQRPDGSLDYQAPDSNYTIKYIHSDLPGFYQLTNGRQVIQPIGVNVAGSEAGAHAQSYDFEALNVFSTGDQSTLVTEIMNHQSGTALWPLFLSLLLLLWVVETYLSRVKSTWRQND